MGLGDLAFTVALVNSSSGSMAGKWLNIPLEAYLGPLAVSSATSDGSPFLWKNPAKRRTRLQSHTFGSAPYFDNDPLICFKPCSKRSTLAPLQGTGSAKHQ